MSEHGGMFGAISEAIEIAQELGVSAEEARRIQGERSDARVAAYEAEQAAAAAAEKIIQFPGPRA